MIPTRFKTRQNRDLFQFPPTPPSWPAVLTFVITTGAGLMLLISLAADNRGSSKPGKEEKLKVVATTTIVADVVRAVGGETINLTILLPIGADVHGFEPSPGEVAAVAGADVIFINGAGLELFMARLLQNTGDKTKVISVSEGVTIRDSDPHVWFDPTNVIIWTENIKRTLSDLDSSHQKIYASNAQKFKTALENLDLWIQEQVNSVPLSQRNLVSDHDSFGYFADRYGFKSIGSVIPGVSSQAEPSAREMANLEQAIREQNVSTIFVGINTNQNLTRQITKDTNSQLVALYIGSLSEPDGPADTYLNFMRHDVSTIITNLK